VPGAFATIRQHLFLLQLLEHRRWFCTQGRGCCGVAGGAGSPHRAI
jgi:hypothetical protein